MRLLIVTNDFPPVAGGIQEYLHNLLGGFGSDEVIVVAAETPGAAECDARLGYRVERLPGKGGRLWPSRSLTGYLSTLAEAEGVDLLGFPVLLPLANMGHAIEQASGIPHVIWHHGAELAGLARLPGLRQAMRRVARRAALNLVVSDWTSAQLRALIGDGPPVRLLRVGIDLDRFSDKIDGSPTRKRFGLGEGPVIVCVGRLVARKGQDTLIRSLQALERAGHPAKLLLVGEGPDEQRLRRLAGATGQARNVVFAGLVDAAELPAAYRAGDIYASPIRTRRAGLEAEGFGVVFIEAAACGIPVVAGRSGGSAEAVRDGETGILVDGADQTQVEAALIKLVAGAELRAQMGGAGRHWAEESFDKARMGATLRGHLSEVLGLS